MSTQRNPSESPGLQLWRISNKWQRGLNRVLGEWGLTHAQYALLSTISWLTAQEARCAQTDIARVLDTDVMMVSQVLRQMEAKELVIRTRGSMDGRVLEVALTPQAVALLEKARGVAEKYDEAFFGNTGDLSDQLALLSADGKSRS